MNSEWVAGQYSYIFNLQQPNLRLFSVFEFVVLWAKHSEVFQTMISISTLGDNVLSFPCEAAAAYFLSDWIFVFVVPRQAVERLSLLNAQTAAHLFEVAQKILKAIEQSDVKIEGAKYFFIGWWSSWARSPPMYICIFCHDLRVMV